MSLKKLVMFSWENCKRDLKFFFNIRREINTSWAASEAPARMGEMMSGTWVLT